MRNTELYNFSMEEMNGKLYHPSHCFTYECLRTLFTLFYDYYFFERTLSNSCKCGKFLSGMCNCLHLLPTAIRSFYFVETDKIDDVIY